VCLTEVGSSGSGKFREWDYTQ